MDIQVWIKYEAKVGKGVKQKYCKVKHCFPSSLCEGVRDPVVD